MVLKNDTTQTVLSAFLAQTERIVDRALKQYDSNAQVEIIPSHDLGFPHDVIRIAGGFATGMYINWISNIPFIPVDTSVNVCTTSIYELSGDISSELTEKFFLEFRAQVDAPDTYYSFNYHRGNHFIIVAKSKNSGKLYLLLHSSANEFKRGLNGLYPSNGNWYFDDIKTFYAENRYLRYLVGAPALLFHKIALGLNEFNHIRQDFMAHLMTKGKCNIVKSEHYDHYYMPTAHSVSIGCHLVDNCSIVPLLTVPGSPIYMLNVKESVQKVIVNNRCKNMVPHGWGKECSSIPKIDIDCAQNVFQLNGISYPIHIDSSLRAHPELQLRDFSKRIDDYFSELQADIDFDVIDQLHQRVSYTGNGFRRWP